MRTFLLAATSAAALAFAPVADATTIITFGQVSGANTVSSTAGAAGSTLAGNKAGTGGAGGGSAGGKSGDHPNNNLLRPAWGNANGGAGGVWRSFAIAARHPNARLWLQDPDD